MIDQGILLAGGVSLAMGAGGAAFAYLRRDRFRSPFDGFSTAEEVTSGIDLTGKTVLITGCNSGTGYEAMRVLALRGAHVLGTARTEEKARQACASVEGRCTPLVMELSDLGSVADCAEQVAAMDVPIDILICNAGMKDKEQQEKDGIELHFLVNHLGHFLLTRRLMNKVKSAPQGRVVVLSSKSHINAAARGICFDDLSGRTWDVDGYAHSKLANGLFSFELARRFRGTRATSNCLSAGRVVTNLFRNSEIPWDVNAPNVKSIAQGASTTCHVATSPELARASGYYFIDCNPAEPANAMRNRKMAKQLWEVSEELVRDYI